MKKLFILTFLLLSFFSKASHIAGGQITYKCLGNNVYEVKLTYFWDCEGGFNPGTSQTINVDGCGNALTVVVNQSTLTPGDGVPADGLCTNSGLTTCKKRIEYIGNITLPSVCNNWVFSLGSCCRGGNITNISGGTSASYYHFATLNNTIVSCNNSPDISIGLLPNFCVNQAACFNLGATEIDGHTLSYAFISAYQTSTTFVTYNATYTGVAPIVGITIDPNTGQINLTPTTIGDFVITVQITEKDANGNIVGTIMRDFQVIVTNCTNQTVTCGQGAITNVTSGTAPSGSTLQICENIPFCFDVSFTDPNLNDSLRISSPNIATSLPGSTMVMSYTPGVKNKIKATICWTPPAGSSGLNTNFVLIVKDNACPVPGTQVLNYFIDVLPATSAGPDQTICGTQAASINAVGSSTVFAWTDLAGTPVPVGAAFSCNPCKNPVIKPAVTSTYVVTNVGGGTNCKNKDTLVINVVPDFTLTAGSSVANSCLNSAVQFTSSINPAGPGYSYTWSPSAPLTSTNTANTSATFSVPGSYNYTVTAISSSGCFKQSNNVPFVAQPVTMPIFTVVPTNTTVCLNTAVPLSVNFGTSVPATCGLAATGCVAPSIVTIGTGALTNGTTAYPAPYANYYDSQHFQLLYTSAELLAAGVVPGKISSLAFNVSALNNLVNPLKNFTIKIKCTSATTAGVFDMVGLSQTYFNASQPVVNGWNTHNFSQSYEWTGSTNLLIDICYDYTGVGYTQNASSPYSTTSFVSVIYYRDDGTNTCPLTITSGTSSNRPNAKFGNCSSTPPASSFSFSWLPVTGLSNPNISNPTATLTTSTLYSVVVTPTAATTCSNVGTTSLTVISPATPTITSVPALCSNAASFTLSALPSGGTWSLTTATSTLGVFTPSLAAIGSNTITYTYGGTSCVQTTTAIVTVERFVPSTITGTINPICIPSPAINLATALPTSTLGTGVWSGNGVNGTAFDPAIAGAGTHTLTYSTNSSPTASLCPSSSTIEVNINSVSQPIITQAGPFCTNASTFALTVTPAGGTWLGTGISSSGVLTPSLATVGNNTYTYTVGSATCSAVNSTTVSIEQYVPSTITGTINPVCISDPMINLATALTTSTLGVGFWSGNGVTGTVFDPSVASSGVHTLTYSSQSNPTATLCPSFSVIAVAVNSVVQPTITPAGPFCDNYAPQQISANPAGGVWSASAGSSVSASGLFTPSPILVGSNKLYYTVTNAPCIKKDSISVDIIHFVPATIIGALGPYCRYNAPVNLQGIAQFAGGVWSGTGVSSGSFTPSDALASTAVTAGTFVITYITNPSPFLNCGETSTTSILVNPKPEVNAFPDSPGGCNYLVPILFSTSTVATGTATWDFGDGSPIGNGLMVTHTYTNSGTYIATITYTDNAGCMDTTQIPTAIIIFPVPDAAFEPSLDVTTVINAEIVFTNQTSDLPDNAYNWNFGGLGTSSETSPTYLFDNSGEYFITLIAVSPDGCQDTAVKKITVNPDVVLYVPNAFTPGNSDGLNDVFQIFLPPTGVDYTTFSLSIYDRWGELIFKTNDVNDSWTGAKNNSGPILKQEIFVWKIEFQDEKKKFYSKMGHVSLLRK